MHDNTISEIIAATLLAAYSIGMNFITVSPPPPYVDQWLTVVLHSTQFVAAFLAIILGCHAIYEKWIKKK